MMVDKKYLELEEWASKSRSYGTEMSIVKENQELANHIKYAHQILDQINYLANNKGRSTIITADVW